MMLHTVCCFSEKCVVQTYERAQLRVRVAVMARGANLAGRTPQIRAPE